MVDRGEPRRFRRRYPRSPWGAARGPGPQGAEGTADISLFQYSGEELVEKEKVRPEECALHLSPGKVSWFNVNGLHDRAALQQLQECFKLHPLVVKGITTVGQRPKLEDYGDYFFIVTEILHDGLSLQAEQIALVIGANFVLTFQERKGDPFEGVREQLRRGHGRLRNRGSDYLAYTLLDTIVDSLYPILENLEDRIEELEDGLVENPRRDTLRDIYELRRRLVIVQRSAWPQRELISALLRSDNPIISEPTGLYLRDTYDHWAQTVDIIEAYREAASNLVEIYLSSSSNRLNEITKVLTIIATIFIPLTFITGLYGMNFNPAAGKFNMPELNWYWGYPASLGLMVLVAVGMILYFRRKGWL